MTTTDTQRAESQARAQLAGIKDLVETLREAQGRDDDSLIEDARQAILEDALSVEVRSGWYSPGEILGPEEYQILLCTGGPAVRIIGDLGGYQEPETAGLEYQDWCTPWTTYRLTTGEEQAVLDYARVFYFGS